MRNTDRSFLICVLLLITLTACNPTKREETPSPTSSIPAATSTIQRPQATVTPTATNTPRPTSTRFFEASVTRESVRPLGGGWRLLGSERFGLQMAAPPGWVDETARLRSSEMINLYGPQMMLLTDTAETAVRLIAGDPIDQGAFILGFMAAPVPPDTGPEEALIGLLTSTETDSDLQFLLEDLSIGPMTSAYVDLAYDPLGLFPPGMESMQYRIYLVIHPERSTPAVFVMGSTADSWSSHRGTLSAMSGLITLPETRANVFGHMISGDLIQGTLTEALDNIWTFTAESGTYATITLAPEEEHIDLTLTLIDPAGNVLTTIDDGYAGDLEVLSDVHLPVSGAYIIEASEFFNEAGRYRMTLSLSEDPHFEGGGQIEIGQEVTADLVSNSEHYWYFDGTAGQSATVILSSLADNFDVILEIRAPDDSPLVVLDEGFVGDAEVLTGYELPLTGKYTIVVHGFADHGGLYSLTLDEGGESTANFYDVGDLIYGDGRQERLRKDEAHAWFFSGKSDDEVTIEVTPLGPTMDMDIWLLDPDLIELVMRDEFLSGERERIVFTLPADGQYLILVREFFGEPGMYEIELSAGGVDELEIAGTLVYSQTLASTLEPGRRAGWSFTGEADDIIDVLLTPTENDRDLVLLLVDPAGNTVITVDAALANSPERLVAFMLTDSGEWTIVVKEFFNEGSDYELLLTRREAEENSSE